MGGACSTYGRDEKFIKYFSWKTGREGPLGRLGHRWGIILEWILGK
jgi:hypothetical protein